MLLQYFGFQREPFGATPDPRCLYLSQTHREALASLDYGYLSNRGFTVMSAPPGMGKTTLLFRFLEGIKESARTVFLFDVDSYCEPQEFVAYILRDIGITPGQSSSEMHEQLTGALARESRAGLKFVVVIDEAQNLSDAVLERIRLLTNFETSQGKLMQIVLSGQPSLADKLMQASLIQLRQRIATRCCLEPLSAAETVAYIEHRLRQAGNRDEQLFSGDALELITAASQGIPRTINSLCFNALSLCCALKSKQVSGNMVSEAIADLRFLPTSREQVQVIDNAALGQRREPLQRKRDKWPRSLWVPTVAVLLVLCATGIVGITKLRTAPSRATGDEGSSSLKILPSSVPAPAAPDKSQSMAAEPALDTSRFEITVERDQTLGKIAIQYLGSFDQQRLNQIEALNPALTDPDIIEIGQKLWLPGPSPMPLASKAATLATKGDIREPKL